MNITYTIEKDHGNFRPKLTIKILIEEWEEKLNPIAASIDIISGRIFNSRTVETDINTGEDCTGTREITISPNQQYCLYLPYRPGKNPQYPEVEQALNELQEKHEAAVLEAYKSIAFKIEKTIEPSAEYKKKIAPWVAKQKMIKGVEDE